MQLNVIYAGLVLTAGAVIERTPVLRGWLEAYTHRSQQVLAQH